MGGRRDTRQHSSSTSRHRSRHHSPRRKAAITADEEEFLKQRTKDRRRDDSDDRSSHHRRHRSRHSPDRHRRHSRSRDREDRRRSKREAANGDKEEERRERHKSRRTSSERSTHSNEKESSARPSSTERSGKSMSVDGDEAAKNKEELAKEASPTSSEGGNKIMDKREERRKRLMQLLQGAEIKDPLREEKRVVLQPWQDDELEIDEDEAKKPVVFGLDAMGSVANSILRMENMNKKDDKKEEEKEEEEEEDALDKYMEELTAKTGVTVGGGRQGASAAVAAAGMSVMDAAMQNNTIDLDEIEKLNKAEEEKKTVKKAAEIKEEEEDQDGTVEDEDEEDEAYYAAFREAIKEAKKENENAKEIFAPVYEKDEELAPEKPEVFYEEDHDAADDNEDSSSSSDESDDEEKEEGDGKEEGESEKNKTALALKSEIKEVEDISRMSYFELAKQFVSKKELPPVDHSKIEYYPIKKNLYKQVREISNMPEHEVAQLRQSNGDIRVRGKHCPRPIKSFAMAGLDVRLLRMLDRKGISTPFPIQMQAIPALLCGRDVIAIAPTGSGKTLAYLLPMIRHVMAQPPLFYNEGPIGLVIAPTRELALQIHAQAEALCHAVDLKCACAYGGGIMGPQLSKLKAGCHILVATPGRLIDVLTLSNGKVTNLRRVSTVTLDEADRMFDMGFEPQISMVLQNINPARQTCMFSATFPPHVEGLARQSLYKPVEIVIGDSGSAAVNVKQQVIVVRDEEERFNNLLKLLGEWADHGSIIVFFTKQDDVDGMYMKLLDYGYACLTLHGGQDQQDRDGTIDDFKKRKPPPANILLATSVAARGLDVKHCICVINYTPPDHAEDYVHRVGRTGRAGNVGFAYTLINSSTEGEYASELVDVLKAASQDVPADLVLLAQNNQVSISAGLVARKRGGFGGRGFTFESSELSRNQQQRQVEMEKAKAEADGTRLDKLKKEEEAGRGMTAAQAAASAAAKAGVQSTQQHKTNGPPAVKPAPPPGPPPPGQARKPPPPPGPPPAASKKAAPPLPKGPPPKGAAKKASPPPPKGAPPTGTKSTNVASAAQAAVDAAKNYKGSAPKPGPPPVGRNAAGNASALVAVTPQGASNSALALLGGDRDSFAEQLAAAAASVGDIQVARTKAAAGEVVEELEINDYPQLARAKVSNRELRGGIEERTGCRLQIKGQFYQKNAYVPPGCRKLYIEIIGNSAVSCQRAKAECRDVCEEWAKTTLNIPQGRLMRTNMPQRKRRKLDW
ncbi:atp-dependent rna helicase [Perkinsus chesapeaki]|uniref:RNA helicase n=1 Tax=Perkinsus chesapeaki TaxID=330153 RepID=A0A7J6LUC6_PERCH|nr:atp-dependent rna helicase [Perkinsus chesapeaki]